MLKRHLKRLENQHGKASIKNIWDALFELALEEGKLDLLADEVKAVSEIISDNGDLTKLMNHPQIDKEEKVKIIENIFKNRISDELLGLMVMIIEKNHYKHLVSVFDHFTECVKEYKNIGTAYITSAVELSDEQKQAIEKRLLDTTRYVEIEMKFDVDAALIGGMKIRIGDRVVDSSVKTKLEDLTRELTKIQLKVGECAP